MRFRSRHMRSGNMPLAAEVTALTRSAQRPIALLALLALLFAQAAAGLHALKHCRAGDSTGIPDAHSQLCLACASFAPIASAHGGNVKALFVATPAVEFFAPVSTDVQADGQVVVSFRSRAPPLLDDV